MKAVTICAGLVLAASGVRAEPPQVEAMSAQKTGMSWRISVTLSHGDTGWDHYADAWRVEDENGTVIATRELLHPHVEEQPFTRSLSAVMLPDGARALFVRAHCTEHGWNQQAVRFEVAAGN